MKAKCEAREIGDRRYTGTPQASRDSIVLLWPPERSWRLFVGCGATLGG